MKSGNQIRPASSLLDIADGWRLLFVRVFVLRLVGPLVGGRSCGYSVLAHEEVVDLS